jgi:hypothetical protein
MHEMYLSKQNNKLTNTQYNIVQWLLIHNINTHIYIYYKYYIYILLICIYNGYIYIYQYNIVLFITIYIHIIVKWCWTIYTLRALRTEILTSRVGSPSRLAPPNPNSPHFGQIVAHVPSFVVSF